MSEPQYGHDGRHHGTGRPGCPVELHHHHDERCVSPLEERRQRAREAYDDALSESAHVAGWPTGSGWAERSLAAREAVIETATRVRITPEIQAAVYAKPWASDEECLKAAFIAAGFEVEE